VSQITKGLILGSPGPIGSPAICILYGSGPPSANPDPNVANCQIGSIYTDYTGATLWFKTAEPNTWTQITIP
jgi:hypothetical protein